MAARKSSRASDIQLGSLDIGAQHVRRVRSALRKAEGDELASARAAIRRLDEIKSRYRSSIAKIIGRSGIRDLESIRKSATNRGRRRKAVARLFKDREIDEARVEAATRAYLAEAREALEAFRDRIPALPPLPGLCQSPWVTYTAPFAGYSWAYSWTKTSNASTPALDRYLDTGSGHIGSRVEIRVSSADNDDQSTAEYYTGLNVWHVPLMSGPLEVYVAFEFNDSSYSGRVRDEFGTSAATYSQWAGANIKASDNAGRFETQESRIFNFIDVAWGSDDDWANYAAKPRDMHWYYFKTTSTFDQGNPVLLEGGVRHYSWFETDDESVRLTSNVDLRLDRIMVRSCDWDPIL